MTRPVFPAQDGHHGAVGAAVHVHPVATVEAGDVGGRDAAGFFEVAANVEILDMFGQAADAAAVDTRGAKAVPPVTILRGDRRDHGEAQEREDEQQ